MKICWFLLIVLLFFPFCIDSLTLRMKPRAYINRDLITIGDITEFIDGEESYFESIKNKKVSELEFRERFKNINSNKIRAAIDNQNINFIGNNTVVRWSLKEIPANRLVSEVETFLKNELSLENDFLVNLKSSPSISVPENGYELNFSINETLALQKRISVNCEVLFSKNVIANFNFWVEVLIKKEVYIAKNNIKRNSIIKEEDLKIYFDYVNLFDDIFSIKDDIVGKISLRHIRTGSFFNKNYLRKSYDVKRNTIVPLVLKNNNMTLKIDVMAKENGYIGSTIEVENIQSRQRFIALISTNNSLIINLED